MISQGMNEGRRRGESVSPSIVAAKDSRLSAYAKGGRLSCRIESHCRIPPNSSTSSPDKVHHGLTARRSSKGSVARRADPIHHSLGTPKTRSPYATRAKGTSSTEAGRRSLQAPSRQLHCTFVSGLALHRLRRLQSKATKAADFVLLTRQRRVLVTATKTTDTNPCLTTCVFFEL